MRQTLFISFIDKHDFLVYKSTVHIQETVSVQICTNKLCIVVALVINYARFFSVNLREVITSLSINTVR